MGRLAPESDPPISQGNPLVTKKEIVKTISDEIGLTQLKTKEIVQKTFELRNFGVFEVKRRAARKARNPRTGEKVFVDEKFVVTFKPGKEMEERVKELEQRVKAEAEAARGLGNGAPASAPPSNQSTHSPTSYGTS